jgi:1,4-dihydroxy-2-naphthoate octaprenyltransferase
MSFSSFLKLVEIQTKVASITPLILGTVFAFYRYRQFNLQNFVLMLVSLLTFDMATTAINNYLDYKKAKKTEGYGYEKHNAIVRDNLKESTVLFVIFSLLAIAVAFGILLFVNTSIIVLVVGVVSFTVGVLYTFGPIPISRMPLGEIFSGFFMGFVILFLSVYIHIVDLGLFHVTFANSIINISLDLFELMVIFLVALPATIGIANLMLANNICDIEDDLVNKRYTLPIYIGKAKSLVLFQVLYLLAYVDLVLLLIFRVLPLTAIPILLTILPVHKNVNSFLKVQSKQDTFVVAIKNFMLINVAMIVLIAVAILLW